ncbi:LOW QUALITY PROTEIN: uncharacterized protein EMH_0014150 [Eimeria mitis]|uniref:Uncharacterized protein n=1 Tax=Eimeria mitis TaxID=44415 RepID=U6KBR0_9EIME|nr:LOW QUALITY PROTEIN: uncharacterized protein EMH_0014150 [Eimeria mitis]CDJ32903.1 hypothetical protein, conserved [Eimeria mitis]
MRISAPNALKSVALVLCWFGLVPDRFDRTRSLLTIASELERTDPPQTETDSPSSTENLQYEGLFALPADGADPFDGVSFLANAVALKKSHVGDEMLQNMAGLIQELIHEEAHNIQHQTDLWLISQTKIAVDTLHKNPAAFPATGYSLQEGSNGALYVKDVMNDVMGMALPGLSAATPPEDRRGDFPIDFGYNTTHQRTVKFSFGDSEVTVACDKILHSGATVGVSHGSYAVTIHGSNNSKEGTNAPGPPVVDTGLSPTNPNDIVFGAPPMPQARISTSAGPGSIVASYQNTRIKFDTHPEGKRHGAEFGNNDFVIGVTRDFDDRINIVKHEVGPYSILLETDLADDKDHAYSGRLTAKTPQTGRLVFGGGFDETNYPTTALALEARDMSITFNGKRGDPGYNVRIGPFVFDVVLSNGLPEFILREVKP